MNYTREQLINAQIEYNKDAIKEDWINTSEPVDDSKECATEQIDYLLSKVK